MLTAPLYVARLLNTPLHSLCKVRSHYQLYHAGEKYPDSVARKQAFKCIEELYEKEVTRSPDKVPTKHSCSTFKKYIQGERADDEKRAEYQQLQLVAYPNDHIKSKIRELIHWYWKEKCDH